MYVMNAMNVMYLMECKECNEYNVCMCVRLCPWRRLCMYVSYLVSRISHFLFVSLLLCPISHVASPVSYVLSLVSHPIEQMAFDSIAFDSIVFDSIDVHRLCRGLLFSVWVDVYQ